MLGDVVHARMVPAGWVRRSARVDDQRGAARQRGRRRRGPIGPNGPVLDGARPDAPLRALAPATVEAARRAQVQRARPLAVADERCREPALGRRLEQHDRAAGQAVRDAAAAPGRRGSGRRRRRPGPPPRRPATRRARPRRGRARPSPSPRPMRTNGGSSAGAGFASPPGTPSNTRRPPGSGSSDGDSRRQGTTSSVALPNGIAKACSCQSCRDVSAPSRRARSAARRSGSSACQVRRAHSPHSSRRSGDSPPDANPSRSYSRRAGALPLNTPR